MCSNKNETAVCGGSIGVMLALVVRMVDNAIHRIIRYPLDSEVCFANIQPLDSDLSDG